MPVLRNARADAQAMLGDRGSARVLEPSPPAVGPPDFTDDPLALDGADDAVTPVGNGAHTWADIVADDPSIAEFCSDRWLASYKPLTRLPRTFHDTRAGLARLAMHVVYRARRNANGKYGLRWTLGGFGTPFFGADEQVRVSGGALVRQVGDHVRVQPITSLAAAGRFAGVEVDPDFDHGVHDVVDAGDVDADLGIDALASLALGDWYGFAWSVLSQIRTDEAAAGPSLVQLWPEHFDVGMDLAVGEPAGERRTNLGASPGDGFHAEPYLYVGPWTDDRPGGGDYWNAPFGAVLGYEDVVAAGDGAAQRLRALAFIEEGLSRLRS